MVQIIDMGNVSLCKKCFSISKTLLDKGVIRCAKCHVEKELFCYEDDEK